MFRADTVFVIGAGASAEFGLPLGAALLSDVAARVDISYDFGRLARGDSVVAHALEDHLDVRRDPTVYNEHLHAAWQLVKSSRQALSIDNVLEALEDEKASTVGKFGIVRAILSAEDKLDLSAWAENLTDQIKIEDYSDTWLDRFAKLLTENVKKSEIERIFSNITFINFNYDRIIEQYLPFAISEYYGVKASEVQRLFNAVPMYRPYGKAGNLSWEDAGSVVHFGHSGSNHVKEAASRILTFTEQVEDADLIAGIRNAISNADRIVFLGFGFHRQNIELLTAHARDNVEIYGTTYGMSKSDVAVVDAEIEQAFELDERDGMVREDWFRPYDLTCSQLLSEIWRTLTSDASATKVEPFYLGSGNL